jgi:hypothetical protein
MSTLKSLAAHSRDNPDPHRDQPLVIVVEPVGHRDRYCATIGGRLIVSASAQPFLDAARILVGEGHDVNAVLEMRRPGAASWDLRGPLWAAARLDVERGRFVRHRAIRPEGLAGASTAKLGTLRSDAPAERTGGPARRLRAIGDGP